jgi:signal transduction histidine kinase
MKKLSTSARVILIGISFIFAIAIGYYDYVTGYTIDFFLFYLVPITAVAWYCSALSASVISVVCAVTWLISDFYTHPQEFDHIYTFYNTLIRLAVFLMITFLIWGTRIYREKTREFTEFIVHDLRSPLATISMGLVSITGACKTMPQDVMARTIRSCKASADRMTELVNSILDLSRISTGKMEISLAEVDLLALADHVIDETSVYAERKELCVRGDVDGGLTGTIRTDEKLLIRILVNLVSNAVKVSPPGKVVDLFIAPEGESGVKFSIVDNGPGIPKDMLDRVFDKFVRLKSGESRLMASSGLGLTFCKYAVEALGGRIWLESEVGKGTTVSFVLPIKEK